MFIKKLPQPALVPPRLKASLQKLTAKLKLAHARNLLSSPPPIPKVPAPGLADSSSIISDDSQPTIKDTSISTG